MIRSPQRQLAPDTVGPGIDETTFLRGIADKARHDKEPHRCISFATNIAHQQQVNNGMAPPHDLRSRAREAEPPSSNELLEDKSHDAQSIGMDTGKTRPASGADPQLATVGGGDRAAHG